MQVGETLLTRGGWRHHISDRTQLIDPKLEGFAIGLQKVLLDYQTPGFTKSDVGLGFAESQREPLIFLSKAKALLATGAAALVALMF
jgi:hypothetical protein